MLGEFDTIAPDIEAKHITLEHLKTFIHTLVKIPEQRYDLQCVEKALRGLRMPMQIADPIARVLHFTSCFFELLERVGCKDNPEKATELN